MTVANITPLALTDGIPYATSVPLVANEATLGDSLKTPDPISIVEGQTIIAVVQLTTNGHIIANNTYVFLQTDLGDGNWIDVAWLRFTATDQSSPAIFVLCGGGIGAMNNAFAQRKSGSAPAVQNSGSNNIPLGGRARFTGFTVNSAGSSSLFGTAAGVLATITYKLQQPR